MGTYKVFDGTNWVDICDCALNVFHPVQGWTDVNPSNCVVKYFDGTNWCPINCGGAVCTCPNGYVFNPTTNLCERVVFQSGTASASSGCTLYSIVKGSANSAFNNNGAYLWEDITSKPYPLIGWKNSSTGFYRIIDNNGLGTQLNVIGNEAAGNNIFKGSIMGRMNYSSIETSPAWPWNTWLKITRCITITEERQYILGFSSDNEILVELKIGSNPYQTVAFLSSASQIPPPSPSGSATSVSPIPFAYWHMFPITLPVGTHIFRISGRNGADGTDFAFGAEIYQMTEAEMLTFLTTSHTDPTAVPQPTPTYPGGYPTTGDSSIPNDLSPYIIFSTRQLVTTPPLQTVLPGCTITYTCPPGTEPNFCYGVTACAVVETTPCN